MKNTAIILIIFLLVVLLSKKLGEVVKIDKRFDAFLDALQKLGYKIVIVSGVRTHDEQDTLHRKDSRNAPAGGSSHEHGKALDISLFKKGLTLNKSTSKAEWLKTGVPQLANKMGVKWGGDFKNYHDPVHFYVD